jgi:hypothetical protein
VLLQSRREIRRIPNGRIIHEEVVPNTPDHHEPTVEPHAEGTCLAIGLPEVCLCEGALECERCQHATSGVIFMGERCPE